VGGVVLFVGTIRNRDHGKTVTALEYETYRKMAERRMKDLEKDVRKKWPIKDMVVVHREGKLKVGEVSVVVAVSAEHRAEAFDAARYVIDQVKETLPIWKRETLKGGKSVWVEGTPIRG
jgi:molybdopterin synthase catalytic subunit